MATTSKAQDEAGKLRITLGPAAWEAFEALCAAQDTTPTEVLQELIREFIKAHRPAPWDPPSTRR